MDDVLDEFSVGCDDGSDDEDAENDNITELPICTACGKEELFMFIVCTQCKQNTICYDCYIISREDTSKIQCYLCEKSFKFAYSERLQTSMEQNVKLDCRLCGEKLQLCQMPAHVHGCTSLKDPPEKKKQVLGQFEDIENHKKQCMKDLQCLSVMDNMAIENPPTVTVDIVQYEYYDCDDIVDDEIMFIPSLSRVRISTMPNKDLKRKRTYGENQDIVLEHLRTHENFRTLLYLEETVSI